MHAYEQCLSATSSHHAPWYAVPADDKDHARLIVSHIVLKTLAGLDMAYPASTPQHEMELADIRKRLAK